MQNLKLVEAFLALLETIAFLWIELIFNVFLLGVFLLIYGRVFVIGGVRNTSFQQKKEIWWGMGAVYSEFYKVLRILVQLQQGI